MTTKVTFTGTPNTTRHGDRMLAPGDSIECSEADAAALTARGNFTVGERPKKVDEPKRDNKKNSTKADKPAASSED